MEDQADFRRLMNALPARQSDLEVVAQAGPLAEARKVTDTVNFYVAILDLGLPDGGGADLIAELRRGNPGMTVLILSATLDPTIIAKASDAGADEIMDKLSSFEEVLGAVRHLANT